MLLLFFRSFKIQQRHIDSSVECICTFGYYNCGICCRRVSQSVDYKFSFLLNFLKINMYDDDINTSIHQKVLLLTFSFYWDHRVWVWLFIRFNATEIMYAEIYNHEFSQNYRIWSLAEKKHLPVIGYIDATIISWICIELWR